MTATPPSNEITLIRIFAAPLKAVWDAWTDPEQVAVWWGPRGFTLTTHHRDTRTGGSWKYTMHGPDGTNYENTTRYLDVVPLKKLVYDHGANENRPPLCRVTALFAELSGGNTKLHMTMTFATPEVATQTQAFIKKAGGNSTWDRLAEYLEKRANGTETFVIARAFDVPIARMYDLWTTPKHLAQWLPPTGFTMEFIECDLREGGQSFYSMGNGTITMYGTIAYLAMERPKRIVYTQQFADEKRNVSRHPMAPTWPETMLTTVEFAEEGPDRTRVVVTWQPHGPATPEEMEAFIKARGGMTQGWTGSFDKLEAYLQQA